MPLGKRSDIIEFCTRLTPVTDDSSKGEAEVALERQRQLQPQAIVARLTNGDVCALSEGLLQVRRPRVAPSILRFRYHAGITFLRCGTVLKDAN